MNTPRLCPTCGKPIAADAPHALCPACLAQGAFATGSQIDEPAAARARFTAPTLDELAPLFPQLELLEFIGQGGMGAVYKARQRDLDRLVALKILPPGIGDDPAFAERFTREARALARLNHPGIVTLYEFGVAAGVSPAVEPGVSPGGVNAPPLEAAPNTFTGQSSSEASSSGGLEATPLRQPGRPPLPGTAKLYYFLMEFVDGVNLRQLLRTDRVSPREALAIVPQICDALQFAHDQGIVHRDIKPENLLLDRRGRVKVADFGLAKLMGNDPLTRPSATLSPSDGERTEVRSSPALTAEGKVLGTPHYMAPEQSAAPGEVDHRADIYALGVVFYQMLTGELPDKQLQPPSKKVQIDVRLDEIVLRALEKNPERRFQQVSDLKTRVETLEATTAETAAETPRKDFDWENASRVWLFVSSLVLVLVLGIWFLTGKTFPLGSVLTGAFLVTYAAMLVFLRLRQLLSSSPKGSGSRQAFDFGALSLMAAGLSAMLLLPNLGLVPETGRVVGAVLAILGLILGFAFGGKALELEIPKLLWRRAQSGSPVNPPSDSRFASWLDIALSLVGALGTLVLMTLPPRHEMALIFGGMALVLALVFGCLSWRQRMGKAVAVTTLVLAVGLGITVLALVWTPPWKLRAAQIDQAERLKQQSELKAAVAKESSGLLQFRLLAEWNDQTSPADTMRLPELSPDAPARRVLKTVELDERHVLGARLVPWESAYQRVELSLTPEGTRRFAQLTSTNKGRQLGILWKGRLLQAPTIGSAITSGTASITGDLSELEATDLVWELNGLQSAGPKPGTVHDAELLWHQKVDAKVASDFRLLDLDRGSTVSVPDDALRDWSDYKWNRWHRESRADLGIRIEGRAEMGLVSFSTQLVAVETALWTNPPSRSELVRLVQVSSTSLLDEPINMAPGGDTARPETTNPATRRIKWNGIDPITAAFRTSEGTVGLLQFHSAKTEATESLLPSEVRMSVGVRFQVFPPDEDAGKP